MPVSDAFAVSVVLVSFAVTMASYRLVCRKEGSYINVLTPLFLIQVGSVYVLPLVYFALFGAAGPSHFAYIYTYLTYGLTFLLTAMAYVYFKPLRFEWRHEGLTASWMPWLVLLCASALYAPVLWEFRSLLLTPREIYTQTRTGYGVTYYGSGILLNIALVLFLFGEKPRRLQQCLFLGSCLLLSFEHGSKGQVFTLLLVWLFHFIYVRGYKVRRWLPALAAGAALSAVLLVGFAMFGTATDLLDFATGMANYSDYSRNAMMVIDDRDLTPYYGQLTLESQVYAVLPRAIFPSKPKNFGDFRLAERYFPEWFDADTGSPNFSIGLQYADFGPFAVFYLSVWALLAGVLARSAVEAVQRQPNPANFILLLFFAGIDLVPVGSGYLLPEHLALAVVAAVLLQVRLFTPRVGAGHSGLAAGV